MSYVLSFPISATLKGAKSGHKVYKMSLVPVQIAGKTPSLYYSHFSSAIKVRLLDVQGVVFCPRSSLEKPASIATAAIVDDTNTAATVHELARGRDVASEGSSARFELSQAIGVRRILKGVADDGGLPAIHLAVASSWDAETTDSVVMSAMIKVEFSGESDAVAYQTALTFA
jgi:hypothetical protein